MNAKFPLLLLPFVTVALQGQRRGRARGSMCRITTQNSRKRLGVKHDRNCSRPFHFACLQLTMDTWHQITRVLCFPSLEEGAGGLQAGTRERGQDLHQLWRAPGPGPRPCSTTHYRKWRYEANVPPLTFKFFSSKMEILNCIKFLLL